jgi:Tol biopolymer transport system component
VFSSTRKGGLDLYLRPASGTRDDELLLATPQIKAASSWSPDGRVLLYLSADPKTGFDIWALPVDGDRKPFPVVQTKSNERLARFSPDGKWIAYESDESGRYEIYVQLWSGSSAPAGGKVPISTTGGAQPQWRHDGRALFYIAPDDRLMTVPIRFAASGQAIEPGASIPLFATRVGGAVQVFPRQQYLVSPDDRRFLMVVEREDEPASPITLLLNWAGRKE